VADSNAPDGVPDGVVDQWDYNYWKAKFGAANGRGSDTHAVPNPSTIRLLLIGVCLLLPIRRRFEPSSTKN
jgi:hypothetical protein